MFTSYFAQELAALEITRMTQDDVAPIQRFSLRKELPYREGMAIFRCECAGPDGPLVFLTIPADLEFDGAVVYLQGMFGQLASLMFVDDADDVITIDSPESWEYCVDLVM
jgi:hypothetical protein